MVGRDGAGPHIVVIDDDAAIRALFRDLFEAEGFRATLLDAPIPPPDLRAFAPDLLVLDLIVGGRPGTGEAYLRRLKVEPTTASLPVLVCSAATDAIDRMRDDLERWSCAICPKPFDLDELLDAVRACLTESGSSAATG
ncbi:MAG TPA: response regulator [Thermomicrobiales bacterium]|nr:response regulator [Thermomicrobiales bacterium]